MCVAFIAGIVFVYSCGGGGSSSGAATIEELEARIVAMEAKLANVVIDNNPLAGLSGPHFIFSGVNVHVRNGAGRSDTTNGVGNIIIGYNESGFADITKRAGSHNLVIGQSHEYSRYNGLVAGYRNKLEGNHATVSGGAENVAGGDYNSVTGGRSNATSARYTSVTGGAANEAIAEYASVTGGTNNMASAFYAVVSGGRFNDATGNFSSISGGQNNVASGINSSVAGGYANSAGGENAAIAGGNANSAGGDYASIGGGNGNSAPVAYQSDEMPDYDSGWQAIGLNSAIDFVHNLGGDTDDYTVVLDQKDTTTSNNWHGIHNHYLGSEVYYVNNFRFDTGTYWVDLTTTTVRVWSTPYANYADAVRIRIWVHKS